MNCHSASEHPVERRGAKTKVRPQGISRNVTFWLAQNESVLKGLCLHFEEGGGFPPLKTLECETLRRVDPPAVF